MQQKQISLVIDGSGSAVFAGLLNEQDQWLAKIDRAGTPLEELFPAIQQVLHEADLSLAHIGNYIYCEGPGSVLGLRLCAMAIETWSRLYPGSPQFYKYNSLHLVAYSLLQAESELQRALIVADWKKGAWNALYIRNGEVGAAEVIDDAQLATWKGPLYHLPQRKGWQSPPAQANTIRYQPAQLSALRNHSSILNATSGVELYSNGINTFQKWTPERHRA
ncbi:hypothetical protein QEH59_11450 [Coraliomargarita sp. SDUM461004]|uniref:Gcp-like domain-containing protein n=1 Tax=Thalassobacterium sedimentorum TaxID=3041258 RepID=A0ABU1AJW4_9BACT|nr:hypothetical protein [Coraliomargarita sp. SDUM461004]MDQ8195044.1 hypothetical protein [Coraliomargarita sp. SDUM461004]